MKRKAQVAVAGVLVAAVVAGVVTVYVVTRKNADQEMVPSAGDAAGSSEDTPPMSRDAAEAALIYEDAQKAYETGDLKAERKAYEQLVAEKFASLTSKEEIEGDPQTYGDLAKMRLPRLDCQLANETGGAANPARTAEETVAQVVKAMAAKDKKALLSLISCNVSEGVPDSEFDPTSRELAASHLLGETGGDGYGSVPTGSAPFRVGGLKSGFFAISNGKDEVSLAVDVGPSAPKTARVLAILWGPPPQQ